MSDTITDDRVEQKTVPVDTDSETATSSPLEMLGARRITTAATATPSAAPPMAARSP